MNYVALFTFFIFIIIFCFLFSIGLYVFVSIYTGKIFVKAGEKFWKGFIPYYSSYIQFKISWKTKYFWMLFLPTAAVPAVLGIIANTNVLNDFFVLSIVLQVISIVFTIAAFIVSFGLYVKISWSFGHGIPYAVGMFFLPVVFFPIIAFGKSEYIVGDVEKYGKLGF